MVPVVSVIIPAYNYGRFIADALRSVQAQSFASFECIVIDNGSTDNTEQVVRPFLSDERFIYLKQRHNSVSAARNKGIQAAKGTYVAFLDADDLIERDKFREQVIYLDANRPVAMVYSGMRYFRDGEPGRLFYSYACDPSNDRPWMSHVSGGGQQVASRFLEGNQVVISAPLTRKEVLLAISAFDETLSFNEDWDLWTRIILGGNIIHCLDVENTMTLVRIHQSSASRDVFAMQLAGLRVLLKNRDGYTGIGLGKRVNERIREHVDAIMATLARTGDNAAFRSRLQALRDHALDGYIFNSRSNNVSILKLYLRLRLLFR